MGDSTGKVTCRFPVNAAPTVPAAAPAPAPISAPAPPPAIAPIAAPPPDPPPIHSQLRFLWPRLTRVGRLVFTSYLTPFRSKESRRSAKAARPLNRPDSADVTTCPSNGVPRGTATRSPTTNGSSNVAEKWSPARFRLVSIVCASRTRTVVPGVNTKPLRREFIGADVGAADVDTDGGAVLSAATGVTCPLLHPAVASTKTLSALPKILF